MQTLYTLFLKIKSENTLLYINTHSFIFKSFIYLHQYFSLLHFNRNYHISLLLFHQFVSYINVYLRIPMILCVITCGKNEAFKDRLYRDEQWFLSHADC